MLLGIFLVYFHTITFTLIIWTPHILTILVIKFEDKKSILLPNDVSKIFLYITKTCLYNFDPLKPPFYIVKLGFTGVYIIFLLSAQNIDCGYSLEPSCRGSSNEYHNLCFEQKYEKISKYFI